MSELYSNEKERILAGRYRLMEEIGDNVLECEGEELSFVEDYREDVEFLIGGN